MIAAENVTDGGGALAERLVDGESVLIHRVEYASMYGLQAVPHVRERAGNNDAHRVLDERFPHLFFHADGDNFLFGIRSVYFLP